MSKKNTNNKVQQKKEGFSSSKERRTSDSSKPSQCFACGKVVANPDEGNHLGNEIICDECQKEMVSSLEAAWIKHSAFLDSALN